MKKEELRKIYLAKRKDLELNELSISSLTISQKLQEVIKDKNIVWAHCFLSMPGHFEIETSPIFQNFWTNKINTVVPVSNFSDNTMRSAVYLNSSEVSISKFGIPEPTNGKFIDEKLIDCVITPMIIGDENGHRVGYGKGFYDKFFTVCRPNVLKIGVCLFEPIKTILDVNESDLRVDVLITPNKIHLFNK